jgi:hypothetical protein
MGYLSKPGFTKSRNVFVYAGGTSGHGIGHLSNEVTATFAIQRVHSQEMNTKVRLAGSIACSFAQVWVRFA